MKNLYEACGISFATYTAKLESDDLWTALLNLRHPRELLFIPTPSTNWCMIVSTDIREVI